MVSKRKIKMKKTGFFFLFIFSLYIQSSLSAWVTEIQLYTNPTCNPNLGTPETQQQDGDTSGTILGHLYRCSFFGDYITTKYRNCSFSMTGGCTWTSSLRLENNRCYDLNSTEFEPFYDLTLGYESAYFSCTGYYSYFLIYYGLFPLILLVPCVFCIINLIIAYACRDYKNKKDRECVCCCPVCCCKPLYLMCINDCKDCWTGKQKDFDKNYWLSAFRLQRICCNCCTIVCLVFILIVSVPVLAGIGFGTYMYYSLNLNTNNQGEPNSLYYYINVSQQSYALIWHFYNTFWFALLPVICVLFCLIVTCVYFVFRIIKCFIKDREETEEEELKEEGEKASDDNKSTSAENDVPDDHDGVKQSGTDVVEDGSDNVNKPVVQKIEENKEENVPNVQLEDKKDDGEEIKWNENVETVEKDKTISTTEVEVVDKNEDSTEDPVVLPVVEKDEEIVEREEETVEKEVEINVENPEKVVNVDEEVEKKEDHVEVEENGEREGEGENIKNEPMEVEKEIGEVEEEKEKEKKKEE